MDVKASTLVHRLLFHALLEMRDQGHTTGDKLVYRLADLFHNVALQMEPADRDENALAYDDILQNLKEHARRTGTDKWVEQRIQEIEATIEANTSAT